MSQPLLNIAKRAAVAAGKVLSEGFDKLNSVHVEMKGINDYVTEIDVLSEKVCTETIKSYYPDDIIIGEETFKEDHFDPKKYNQEGKHTWIIDPLDGTYNFIKGNPQFAVSIAVQENGVTVAGVVYNPITNTMYSAAKGCGAQVDNKRLRMTPRERGTGYKGAVLATGFPYKEPQRLPHHLNLLVKLFETGMADIRRYASASLDMCFVAEGRFDGYFEEGIRSWDIAAGEIIIKEAGGFVMDYKGDDNYLYSNEVVCGSIEVCREVVKLINRLDNAAAKANK